jgi:hypothetical protein
MTTQASSNILSNARNSLSENVAEMQQKHDELKAQIVARLAGLNYWGKRLDSVKKAVLEVVFSEFEIEWAELQEIAKTATPPKKEKSEKVAKEAKPDNRPLTAGILSHAETTREVISGDRFIITSCQNNTETHSLFFDNLKAYAEFLGAKLLILPFIYNKNAFQNGKGSKEEIFYNPELKKYFQENDCWLGDNKKVFLAALNILPTVKKPLSGLQELMQSAECLIVPHATIQHENIAVLGAQHGRVVPSMFSTGAVTMRNYIEQKAGQAASGRHCFAATLVEFNENGQFWVRQLQTDESGNFQDLTNKVENCQVSENNTVLSISWGDIHAEQTDDKIATLQWGNHDYSVLNTLKPAYQFCHDLLDFKTLNHHNRDNNFHLLKNHVTDSSVETDLKSVEKVLSMMHRSFTETLVVYSNHDDSLTRWLSCNKYNAFNDPQNALLYYTMQAKAHETIKGGGNFEALPFALEKFTSLSWDNLRFLKPSESFIIGNIEQAEHGHHGANGSRGSKVSHCNYKVTTGHTHSSSINGGQYVGGVSAKLCQGYNENGASSWVHAAVVSYDNGQRTIIHCKPIADNYNSDQFNFKA